MVPRMLLCFAESAHLDQGCDGSVVVGVFVFDGGEHVKGGVVPAAVVEDF